MVLDTIGWAYYRSGRYQDALPYPDKSLRTLERPVAHYDLAAELMRAGDAGRARREYETSVRQDPRSAARTSLSPMFEK